MPYQIAILDDNPTDSTYISTLVKHWVQNRNIDLHMETFPSAEAFLFHYEDNMSWDILLLDIEMGDMNGVELAKMIRTSNSNVQIIFITGFPDFISEGYEVSALHYLMKPVSEPKLQAVLDRAVTNLAKVEKQCYCCLYFSPTCFHQIL